MPFDLKFNHKTPLLNQSGCGIVSAECPQPTQIKMSNKKCAEKFVLLHGLVDYRILEMGHFLVLPQSKSNSSQ